MMRPVRRYESSRLWDFPHSGGLEQGLLRPAWIKVRGLRCQAGIKVSGTEKAD